MPSSLAITAAFGLLLATLWSKAENPDLLLFNNGDTLHGHFSGLTAKGSISWNRKGWAQPASFPTDELAEVIINGGKSRQAQLTSSSIHLTNGDIIPGDLITLSNKEATIQTSFAGQLIIPRPQLTRIQPILHQGELIYRGPSSEKGWSTLPPRTALPPKEQANEEENDDDLAEEDDEPMELLLNEADANQLNQIKEAQALPPLEYDQSAFEKVLKQEEATPSWLYQSGAWHSQKSRPLLAPFATPDRAIIRFRVQWTGNLGLLIALHGQRPDSNLTHPLSPRSTEKNKHPKKAPAKKNAALNPNQIAGKEVNNDNEDPNHQAFNYNHLSHSLQSTYLLRLNQSYTTLQRSYFDQNQKIQTESVSNESAYFRPGKLGDISVEIRTDRPNRLIALFIDGRFITQWIDNSDTLINGDCLAFYNQRNDGKTRLSNFLVTTWDGNMDSANSMDHPDRDILIANNGTDRYSGKIKHVKDGTASLKNAYAQFNIPLKQILDLRFAKSPQSSTDNENENDSSTVHFYPHGHLTLQLEQTDNHENTQILQGQHPTLGSLQIDTQQISTITLDPQASPFINWEE